jgi:ketosteroid isomerase-like protein
MQENVELVRRGYTVFGRGDMDGVLDVLDPELELSDPFGFSTTASCRADSPVSAARAARS